MIGFRFNTPPGWPPAPVGWTPAAEWQPDPAWPPAPYGWNFWVPDNDSSNEEPAQTGAPQAEVEQGPVVQGSNTVPVAKPHGSSVTDTDEARPVNSVQETEIRQLRSEIAELRKREQRLRDQLDRPAHPQGRAGTSVEADENPRSQITDLRNELVELNDAVLLQQVGIYEYHHPLETAAAYKERLADLRGRIRGAVRDKAAIEASERFSYNNSLAQGRKMVSDFSRLMLRAYNAEADNCVRSLRAGTASSAVKRLTTSADTIAKLGTMMGLKVSDTFHALRIEEIELVSDHLMKVQEEREATREERERLREERLAEQELAAERERLEKERSHYLNALEALRRQGKADEYEDLERRLAGIERSIADNDYRAANIRAGYVYVISNIGTFGRHVVKIGMTRRLDPLDRVRELGDASVPFPFDVHALYFSEDAVTLESELHKELAAGRVNQVNPRREFFFATPEQVREALIRRVGNLLEYVDQPEATQYHQSQSSWPVANPIGPAKEY